MQAFMDESWDDGGTFVVAGYISTAERWAAFSNEWAKELANGLRGKKGNIEFKMSRMAQWPDTLAKVGKFQDIIYKHVIMSLSFAINKKSLENALNRLSVDNCFIEYQPKLTPYYVSIRIMLETFNNARFNNIFDFPMNGAVDFFFDENSEKRQILDMWDDFMNGREIGHRALYGSTPRFEDDSIFLPLQAADFRAWWVRKWVSDLGIENISNGEFSGFERPKNKILDMSISLSEEMLVDQIRVWLAQSLINEGLPLNEHTIRDVGKVN